MKTKLEAYVKILCNCYDLPENKRTDLLKGETNVSLYPFKVNKSLNYYK